MDIRKKIKIEKEKDNYFTELKVKCKCGHTVMIPNFRDKLLCDWCGRYVYRNKELEFKEKLKSAMREV